MKDLLAKCFCRDMVARLFKTHKVKIISLIVILFIMLCTSFIYLTYFQWEFVSDKYMRHRMNEVQSLFELRIDTDSVTRNNLCYSLINNTEDIFFRNLESLYIKIGNRWKNIEFIGFHFLILWSIEPNSYFNNCIDLTDAFGILPSGEYKLVKIVSQYEDFRDTLWVVGEFTL